MLSLLFQSVSHEHLKNQIVQVIQIRNSCWSSIGDRVTGGGGVAEGGTGGDVGAED